MARTTPIAFSVSGKYWVNNHAHILKFENLVTQRYVEFYLGSIDLDKYITQEELRALSEDYKRVAGFSLADLAREGPEPAARASVGPRLKL